MDPSDERGIRPDGDAWEAFLSAFADSIQRGRAAILVGAGLSRHAFPDWSGLVWKIAGDTLGVSCHPAMAMPDVAQYVVNKIGRKQLDVCILEALAATEAAVPTAAHKELPGLGLDLLWTTNYDDLIELAYREQPGGLEVVSDDNLFRETGKTTLYKLHGTLRAAGTIVISRGDYEHYRAKHEALYAALLSDLLRRSFLFVGFSFIDPNVYGALYQAERVAQSERPPHFAIFSERDRAEVSIKFRIQDLERLGVQALYVNTWDEIPRRLQQLRRRLSRTRILVSGSRRTPAATGRQGRTTVSEERLRDFSERLGRMLMKEDYTIVCGLNAAVGRPVVNGALEMLHETQRREDVNRRILIWPLPDGHRRDSTRAQMRAGFRKEMASVSGFGIFLGGSDGTRKEHELLIAAGGRALPIGASGGVAYSLWREMRETVAGDLRQDFEALGTLTLEDGRLLVALENLLKCLTAQPA